MRAARSIAMFASFYANNTASHPNPTDKIVKNLCTFICQDVDYAPVFSESKHLLDGILMVAKSVLPTGKPTPKLKANSETDALTPVTGFKLIRRGAQLALRDIAEKMGGRLFDALPVLWECIVQPMLDAYGKYFSQTGN